MRKRLTLLIGIAAFAIPVLCLVSIPISTYHRMSQFRTQISPGMSLPELHAFAGKPAKILHRGEPLQAATNSYAHPTIDEHTALSFYPKEGIPYFNVFVFVDEHQSTVIRSEVESLGW